jgi:hypothetical protein
MTESVSTLRGFLLGDVQEDIRRVSATLLARTLEVVFCGFFPVSIDNSRCRHVGCEEGG